MKIVQPEDRICLMLDVAYMPFAVATARAAFYHMLKSHGHGINPDGHMITMDRILNKTVAIDANQPVMRSANDVWPIPTVFVTNHSFYFKKKKSKESVSLSDLYKHYKGVCQICLKKKPITDFSKEHIFPRSLGGDHSAMNLTLTCKRCNSVKGSQYPYRNANGELLKPAKIFVTGFFIPEDKLVREEWKPYLFRS